MKPALLFVLTSCFITGSNMGATCTAHDGPDPIGHWKFDKASLDSKTLKSRLGPNGTFTGRPRIVKDPLGQSIRFNGRFTECMIADDFDSVREHLPTKALTVSAWVAVDEPIQWGGLIGVMQDNGNAETGWVLGYTNKSTFSFALSTAGADDGDGKMTYLESKTKYELGKMYHVVGVYDGISMEIYVNGKLDNQSKEQSGDILYPKKAPFVIGSYHDDNEFNPMTGRIREISLYDIAAKPQWVAEEFGHHKDVSRLPKVIRTSANNFVIKPYLQFGTQTSMTVMWRSAKAGPGSVYWGENIRCKNRVEAKGESEIQEIRIDGLQPETQYFYMVESIDADGNTIESEISTFQTASKPETPFAFAVISDTQGNPKVNGAIAKLAWARRPNFLLHPGDLVSTGTIANHWIDQFFASMHPLLSRVPMYPVLGNHEVNAKNYYDYMSLPEPEYYYQFTYGNTEFFMVDSNKKVEPGSEQYQWLDSALGKSKANWKFVCHHHPPYSSDENDYGNLWRTNKSTRGDLRVRKLVPLYEKHGVDIVWNGHIHSYERTWPLRKNKAVNKNGTIYMITGGGGGGLETPGPYRPFFQNNVRRGHHYVMVAINGPTLEMKTYSLEDQMIDHLAITKER